MSSEVCTVLDLVTACTAKTPDAPAVVAGGRRITYQELDARANGLAHQLRALGAGPGAVVGLCLNRSSEMVVGALGISGPIWRMTTSASDRVYPSGRAGWSQQSR